MIKNFVLNIGTTVHKAVLVVKLNIKHQACIVAERKFIKEMLAFDPKSKEYKKIASQLKRVRSLKKSLGIMIDAI